MTRSDRKDYGIAALFGVASGVIAVGAVAVGVDAVDAVAVGVDAGAAAAAGVAVGAVGAVGAVAVGAGAAFGAESLSKVYREKTFVGSYNAGCILGIAAALNVLPSDETTLGHPCEGHEVTYHEASEMSVALPQGCRLLPPQ